MSDNLVDARIRKLEEELTQLKETFTHCNLEDCEAPAVVCGGHWLQAWTAENSMRTKLEAIKNRVGGHCGNKKCRSDSKCLGCEIREIINYGVVLEDK